MKLELYKEIISQFHELSSRESVKLLSQKYTDIPLRTLGSIVAQECQRKTKKSHHKHHTPEAMEEYYQRYLASCTSKPGFLFALADEMDLSASLMARIILEKHLTASKHNVESTSRSHVSQLMKDSTLIDDPVLAHEVFLCILHDDNYGSLVDGIKRSIGQEYEFILKQKLQEKGISFQGEDQLRAKGYDKTPDVILQVPIAIDGRVVNWIESKASFGDEDSHRIYLKDQFWSYWNRFGPGMVIYWFGFIDELAVHEEKGILLRDDFPTDIITMNPDVL